MGIEIERKFLVADESWRTSASGEKMLGEKIVQGYFAVEGNATIRVRHIAGRAFLTVKSANAGLVRAEYEYPIPVADAEEMLRSFCRPSLIEKTRYPVLFDGLTWVVDVFSGAHDGLVIAEIELTAPDQAITLPPWVGREVTGDMRYGNFYLSAAPAWWLGHELAEKPATCRNH